VTDGKSKVIAEGKEETYCRTLSLMGIMGGGAEGVVDVKDGKIIRVRPLHYDWKYKRDELNPWKIERNGATLEPNMKSLPPPFNIAYKKRAYSPNRIKYPLKRVDWDPNGERNPQNRGISKYRKISWDEATDIIASEIKRIQKKYGPLAVCTQTEGHGESKTVHPSHGSPSTLMGKTGGFTQQIRNADSWEGWYWGSMHVWGTGYQGMMAPAANIIKDVSENSEMVLCWGFDPETSAWGFCGQFPSRLSYFWRDAGIKQVYICPELNYGAAVHADKWIPVLPNTDAALQLAIIYTWIKEGTYNKEYIAAHTVGFDRVEEYVTGKEDGVPKTPEWASPKCGVPVWTIKALAREFAARVTTIAHGYGGSYIRGPYSTEPARLECILLAMQGLGAPGVHQCNPYWVNPSMPRAVKPKNATLSLGGKSIEEVYADPILRSFAAHALAYQKQHFPKVLMHDILQNPPLSWYGKSSAAEVVEDQFVQYKFPVPKEEGGSEIHMIWSDTPCRPTCWNHGNKVIEEFRNPKIECIVVQHPWMENDCLAADIVLPANTHFEVDDIMPNTMQGVQFENVLLQKQAIKPIGESKSDYEIMLEVARKLGKYEEITEGRSVDDLIKYVYDGLGLAELISWEEFNEKQYYVYPTAQDWEKDPPGMSQFYKDPEKYPLPTPSGKLELYSARLAEHFPDDNERPPMPKWIEKGPTHDERLSSERAKKHPLLLMSNHGRWRVHAQCDDISWTRETPTGKIKGFDGYMYEPLWLNPQTATERGIKSGDIVKVFNERGTVLGGAYVTERLMPGVAYIDHGARVDPIIPGKLDRGGAINLISPEGITSKNAAGMATSGYLVQVEKVSMAEMEEWRRKYPEAFEREYHPASGLRFNAWVVGGK
jgi:molybdopterin guanine dinucleotide-containing S/N-oxide reductase-like protein